MSGAPLHDWLLPRIEALLHEAEAAGYARDVVVAVLIDLVTSPPFDPPDQSEPVD